MHGGIVQGIGMALHEALVYDEGGQLLSGTFQDYYMPRAEEAPHLETVLVENPSPLGPYGVRGVGEPPIVAGAAAIGNAIRDAVGVRVTQLPMKPEVVWRAIQESRKP
jgi:CO/xanthine dehydrogenase Mo-binding subunit